MSSDAKFTECDRGTFAVREILAAAERIVRAEFPNAKPRERTEYEMMDGHTGIIHSMQASRGNLHVRVWGWGRTDLDSASAMLKNAGERYGYEHALPLPEVGSL